jgi:LPXTG-site transpeptidase (sortase) family protein
MEEKILSKKAWLIVISAGLIFSAAIFFYYLSKNSNLPADQFNLLGSDWQAKSRQAALAQNIFVSPKQEQVVSGSPILSVIGQPVRLRIPGINVDSAIESVGLIAGGAMDTPKNFTNVAWFNLGQRPGEIGSAVIAGHYGIIDGKASAFDNLHKLRQGDKLSIEDDKGSVISFVVRESRSYDPDADASGVFTSSDGKSHLNLIACEGIWDETTQSYSRRLVVFADEEIMSNK